MTLPPDDKVVPRKRYWETSDFWKDAGERVITAFIEGTLALISVDVITGPRIDLGFRNALIAGGISAVLSTLKAIVGSQKKDSLTPVGLA